MSLIPDVASRLRVWLGAMLVACGLLSVLALQPPGALASANLNWATGVEALLPANAAANLQDVGLSSVSCASAGDCAAVGSYVDSSGDTDGVLLTETAGVWATGVQARLPTNANANPFVFLAGVECASAGYCAAIGDYVDSSGDVQGMLLNAAPASPTLSASAPASATAGSAIPAPLISATLAGGSAPTGTVSFTVFGPQFSPPASCTSGGATVGSASVSDNGTYHPPAAFTPAGPGRYWWYASYSGDSSDSPAASPCGAAMANTIVPASPTLSASAPATPSVQISSPANGARYTRAQLVRASYTCQDATGGPGIASCTGPDPTGQPIDTSEVGRHSFTVTATSKDGQTNTSTVSYTVRLPSNHFKVSHIKTHRDGTITFRVTVPGAGGIDVLETAWNDNLAHAAVRLQPAARRFVFARQHRSAHRASTLKLRVTPNKSGTRLVHDHTYRATLRLWVTYTPTGGKYRKQGFYGLHLPK